MNEAQHDQAVDRLDGVDRMPAGDRDARLGADRFAPGGDALDHVQRQSSDRHAEQGQGENRLPAHGVHVGNRIGRRDAAEVVGIVDDRHEKIGGRHDRLPVVELVDCGVLVVFDTREQRSGQRAQWRGLEDFRQYPGRDLAAAAAAVRKRRQSQRHCHLIHCCRSIFLETEV
jgi:hypothetical protein